MNKVRNDMKNIFWKLHDIGLTVQLVHGQNIVVAYNEIIGAGAALVVGEHDRVHVGTVGQTQGVSDLVDGHREEVDGRAVCAGGVAAAGSPVLVVVEVDVSAVVVELVGVVGVGQDVAGAVERIPRNCETLMELWKSPRHLTISQQFPFQTHSSFDSIQL